MEDKTSKVTKHLKHEFSEAELKGLGDSMALAVGEQEEAETALKSMKSQIDSRIKIAQANIALCAGKIRTGYEIRPIECSLNRDFEKGTVTIQRDDTYEMVEHRAMSAEEKQKEMFEEKGE